MPGIQSLFEPGWLVIQAKRTLGILDIDGLKSLFIFFLWEVKAVRSLVPHHDRPGFVGFTILDPVHRHVGHDRCVVPLHNSPIFAVEVEFRVKVFALAFVGDEMIKAGTGHVVLFAHVPFADVSRFVTGLLKSHGKADHVFWVFRKVI